MPNQLEAIIYVCFIGWAIYGILIAPYFGSQILRKIGAGYIVQKRIQVQKSFNISRIIAIVGFLEATSKKVFWPNFSVVPSLQVLDILERATEKKLIT